MEFASYYLFPSTLFADPEPTKVSTILGSCVSICLYDTVRKWGGINHFMLPLWNGEGLASPRFGNIATEKLIERMLKQGSEKRNLVAKVFGGARVLHGSATYNVGQRNIDLAQKMLKEANIPVVASHTGGYSGRKIIFNTFSGEVLHQLLTNSRPDGRL